MAKELKKIIVKEYFSFLEDKKNYIFVSFKGLNSLATNELRDGLRNKGIVFRVVKNSLLIIALKEIGNVGVSDLVSGNCGIAVTDGDCVELSKAVIDCEKKAGNFKVTSGYLDGQNVDVDKITLYSTIPDRSVVNCQVLSGIRSPMVGIANSLNAIMRNLHVCLNEIKNKKEV